MRIPTRALLLIPSLLICNATHAQNPARPAAYSLFPDSVLAGRQRALVGDKRLASAVQSLRDRADQLLTEPDVAVTDKPDSAIAPTGDRHDYVSVSVYFWPDPNDPRAPWIPRDGVRNHEAINQFDSPRLFAMCDRVITLAQAYWFTNEVKYAHAAAAQLDRWFLNAQTRMNPNMNFAQSWPNKSAGTPWGIIDSNRFHEVLNSVAMIADSGAWSDEQDVQLRAWFGQWNKWLLESELGIKESRTHNNHAVYYDLQLAAGALYVGDMELADQVLNNVRARINEQIEPDGSMPAELARPDAWSYTGMNLKGFVCLAIMAESRGIDLWRYESADGRSIRKAIEWTIPYMRDETEFTWGDGKHSPTSMTAIFWYSQSVYGALHRDAFEKMILPALSENRRKTERLLLLDPLSPAPTN